MVNIDLLLISQCASIQIQSRKYQRDYQQKIVGQNWTYNFCYFFTA